MRARPGRQPGAASGSSTPGASPVRSTPSCTRSARGADERALIDPVAIDPSGLTTLDSWRPGHRRPPAGLPAVRGRHRGIGAARHGRRDRQGRRRSDRPLPLLRRSPGCRAATAFYYSRRLAPDAVPAGEEQFHRRVYLHRLGTPADADVVILGDGLEKTNYYGVSVSRDGRWLVITAAAGTAPRNDVWIADLSASAPAAPNLQVMQQGVDASTWARRRPGRAVLRLHRPGRAARPDRDRRSGRSRVSRSTPAGRT